MTIMNGKNLGWIFMAWPHGHPPPALSIAPMLRGRKFLRHGHLFYSHQLQYGKNDVSPDMGATTSDNPFA